MREVRPFPLLFCFLFYGGQEGRGGGAGHPDMFKSKQGVLRSCNVDVISKPQQEAF